MSDIHPRSIALFGAGRVGTTVVSLLQGSGREVVGVASQHAVSARRAAERLGCAVFDDPGEMARQAATVLLGVPDSAIASATAVIVESLPSSALVCHFSGVSGIGPLDAARRRGCATAALHPVQSFVDVDIALRTLPGAAWGVTCDDAHVERAYALVHDAGGTPLRVSESDRPVWHAAAVMTSNGLAALAVQSELLLRCIGVERPAAVVAPLARGTTANIEHARHAADVLTGPIVRGEDRTIAAHVEAIARLGSDALDSYRQVTELILSVARPSADIARNVHSALEGATE